MHLISQKYAPFGEYLNNATTAAKFGKGFTNHEQTDASGLIYMQARFYAPMYGRFLSPDPARDQHFEQTQSWNIYSYVQNDPTMQIDPTGMFGLGDMLKGSMYAAADNMSFGATGWLAQKTGLVDVNNQSRDFYIGATATSGSMAVTAATAATTGHGVAAGEALTGVGAAPALVTEGGALYATGVAAKSVVATGVYLAKAIDAAGAGDPSSGSGGSAEKTEHAQGRADQANAGDSHRQVGDANRTIKDGRTFTDTKTGNTVHVRGNRVVVTNAEGKQVTQFKNTRANTQSRIQSGRWKPTE